MTISDDRSTSVAPPTPPPSFVRRHPILAAFGVLSGLSLFSALWPASAIVVSVAIAADATGLDRKAWAVTKSVAERIATAVHAHTHVDPTAPAPVAPAPPAPQPSPPRRDLHAPSPATPRVNRAPRREPSMSHPPVRAGRHRKADHPVETRMDGRGL
jgi:hypothetical protein